MTTTINPAIYTPPSVTDPAWGGVADGLLAPSVTGSGGVYPTGFAGGEVLPLTLEGAHYDIVFTAGDQSLAQVVSRINATIGNVQVNYASASGGQLKIAAVTLGTVITIGSGTALTALGLTINAYYGQSNPAATDNWSAFQRAIYANAGGTLTIPGGAYKIKVPSGSNIGLYINQAIKIIGSGNIINGVAQLLFDDPGHTADFLVIEGPSARGTMIESVTFRSYHNAGDGRHGIVVHAAFVTLERVATPGYGGLTSYALVQESGIVGTAAIIGATRLPTGFYIGSNFLRVYQIDLEYVGDPTTGTGGGFYTHGSDSKSTFYDFYALALGTAIVDSSLIGTTIYGFHDEVGYSALYSDAAGGTRLFDCFTEAFHPPTWISQVGVSYTGDLQAPVYHFGSICKLLRSRRTDGVGGLTWETEVCVTPYDQAITWWRNNETYSSGIGHSVDSQGGNVFAFRCQPTYPGATKGPGWGIGATDTENPRGPCLPIVGRAWLNGQYNWTFRQASVTIVPGLNVVPIFVDYAHATPLAAGDQFLPGVDTSVRATIELHEPAPNVTIPFPGGAPAADAQAAARMADLLAAPMRVGASVLLWQDNARGNWAVQVTNETVGNLVIDILWTFRMWQTSGAATGP